MEALANYHDERDAFAALYEQQCTQRVVFYQGESGSGKTTLLRVCRKLIPDTIQKLLLDFKEAEHGVADIFFHTADIIGWEHLPNFQAQLAALNPQIVAQINDNKIQGSNNIISQMINTGSQEERKDKQIHLTDAWLRDVRDLDRVLLLSMDTYEKSIDEVKTWINRVLIRIPNIENLRLVIAGQNVPDNETSAEWADNCCLYNLHGVTQPEHWIPVVKAMGREFPPDRDPLSYMDGICTAFNGQPADIKKTLEALPHCREL